MAVCAIYLFILINFCYTDKVHDLCAKMKYYHVYTKGLEDDVIFLDREDFVVGMNYVAIACFQCQVTILAFVLMSNHFHFIIYSSRSDAERFIRLYKQMISHYIRLKYGKVAFLQRVAASCDEVSPMDDGLKRCIAYVLDNPVKAGLFCVPQGYEWGSAGCYFSDIHSVDEGTPVTGYSVRELKRILHSGARLDDSFRISSAGYIDPRSYVDYTAVEEIFGRPKSFEFFLSTSASSRRAKRDVIMFSDDLVRDAMNEVLRSKYGLSVSEDLTDDVKIMLIKDIRSCFNAPANQIARVVGCSVRFVVQTLGI